MADISAQMKPMEMDGHSPGVALRSLVIGLTAFLTVVDLFATQAILPSLTRHYGVTPAAMGFAVNASTMGMAIAGLVVGFFSPHIDRRLGILVKPRAAGDARRRCWRARPISPSSPCCASPRGFAWRRPLR